MQKLFSLFCLLVIMQIIQAAPVDSAEAAKIALNFYKQNNVANVVNGLPVREAKPEKNFRNITSATTFKNFYIFNADDGGFVIVSADDRAVPVLGYSDNGFINAGNLPENFKWWLGEYEREIDYAIVNDIAADEVTRKSGRRCARGSQLRLGKRRVSRRCCRHIGGRTRTIMFYARMML
ncbi:MAG: Spi family protease inhibitor [Bacteroidales bacterium]|nr:Spi family protease inhibitor [Bacteroidales bacterium]